MTSTSDNNKGRPPSMRPEPDPIANDVRKQVQARRLPPDAACAVCGVTEPEILRTAKVSRHLLEAHHVAGQSNDKELKVPLCLNHHAIATAAQRDVGALPPGKPNSPLEAMEIALRSLGTFFDQLAQACFRWATQLGQVVTSLDHAFPAWRTIPGMP